MEDEKRYRELRRKMEDKHLQTSPPLPLGEVEAFEKYYGIKLPKAYRAFLLYVGDGGKMPNGCNLLRLSELEVDAEDVKKPFPFTEHWLWARYEFPDTYNFLELGYGNVALLSYGNNKTWNLIVTGECAGEMWNFTDDGVQPAAPRRDFLSWFEYWLDGGEGYFSEAEYAEQEEQ